MKFMIALSLFWAVLVLVARLMMAVGFSKSDDDLQRCGGDLHACSLIFLGVTVFLMLLIAGM